ncbi:hypothetical protein [Deinococcus ficus]|uniref:Uncharacterized protein n=1 Tax=Deinococcus ficus TaxID=317577 RepID=A0A221T3B1_9DEIO|nr:hypothetical protein [Deinococcus ficus]ASN83361.1 hypothetical protein DFI_19375 [Deinococcus ficus]
MTPLPSVDLNESLQLHAAPGGIMLQDHRGALPEGPHDALDVLTLLDTHVPGWDRGAPVRQTLTAWLRDPSPRHAEAAQDAVLADHHAHFPLTARIQACPPLRQELIAQIQMDNPASATLRFQATLTGACLAWGVLPDPAALHALATQALRFRQASAVQRTWDAAAPDPDVQRALKALHHDPAFVALLQHVAVHAGDHRHALHALIGGWLLASGYPRTVWVDAAAGALTFHAQHPQPGDPRPATPAAPGA